MATFKKLQPQFVLDLQELVQNMVVGVCAEKLQEIHGRLDSLETTTDDIKNTPKEQGESLASLH